MDCQRGYVVYRRFCVQFFLLLLPLQFCITKTIERSGAANFDWFDWGTDFHETLVPIESILTKYFGKGTDKTNGGVRVPVIDVIDKIIHTNKTSADVRHQ